MEQRPSNWCGICNKTFAFACELATHLRVHTGVRQFQCDLCYLSFAQKGHLNRHVDDVHERKKPFRCLICGKNFAQASNARTHVRTHTGPWRCSKCHRVFDVKLMMQSHRRECTVTPRNRQGPPRNRLGPLRNRPGPPRNRPGPPSDPPGPPRDTPGPPRDPSGPPRDPSGPPRDPSGPPPDQQNFKEFYRYWI